MNGGDILLNIKISKQDLNNLMLFLDRVHLTGKEVPAYIKIVQILSEAEELEDTEKICKEVK